MPSWKYFKLTLKHKWFVLLAGRKIGVPFFHLLIHDWSKFLPSELPHYGRQFFGDANRPYDFAVCWARHQNRNEHHWEYWVPRSGHTKGGYHNNEPLAMPEVAAREMVADWMGASRAYEGKWPDYQNWKWVKENVPKMHLHKDTLDCIELIVSKLKYESAPF